jgi:hypothetical protein
VLASLVVESPWHKLVLPAAKHLRFWATSPIGLAHPPGNCEYPTNRLSPPSLSIEAPNYFTSDMRICPQGKSQIYGQCTNEKHAVKRRQAVEWLTFKQKGGTTTALFLHLIINLTKKKKHIPSFILHICPLICCSLLFQLTLVNTAGGSQYQ